MRGDAQAFGAATSAPWWYPTHGTPVATAPVYRKPAAGGRKIIAAPPAPVTVVVTHNNGGVQFGTGLGNQPLVGGKADNSGVCGGFSYEQGFCLPVKPIN